MKNKNKDLKIVLYGTFKASCRGWISNSHVQPEDNQEVMNTASHSVGVQFDNKGTSSCFLHILLIHLTCFVSNGICSVYPGGATRKGTDLKESVQTLVMREADSGPLNISDSQRFIQLDESCWKRAGLDIIGPFPRHSTKEPRIDRADFLYRACFALVDVMAVTWEM